MMSQQPPSVRTIQFDGNQHDLSLVTIGLGWKLNTKRNKWWQRLLGPEEEGFDLDAMAILLDSNSKIKDFGTERDLGGGRKMGLIGSDVVFYNNLQHPSKTIWHTGDDLKGGVGGDNEQIIVKLTEVPDAYHKILFTVSIHQGQLRNQHFGMVKTAYIRSVDARGKEIGRFSFAEDHGFEGKCTVVLAQAVRQAENWALEIVGDSYASDSFVEVLKNHV